MPGLINGASPVGVLPFSLSTKFSASNEWAAIKNEYSDGTPEIAAIANASRRTWRLSKRLTPAQMVELRAFYFAHTADAFYFYDPKETFPPYSYDPTGDSSDGRYVVRFNSDWSQSMDIARGNADLELIELTGAPDNGISGVITSAMLYITTAHATTGSQLYQLAGASVTNSAGQSGILSIGPGPNGGVPWDSTTQSYNVTGGPLPFFLYPAFSTGYAVNFYLQTVSAGAFNGIGQLLVYDCYVSVTYSDGTAAIIRPRRAASVGSSNSANYINNQGAAIDGDPSTYALIYSDETGGSGPLLSPPYLQVQF